MEDLIPILVQYVRSRLPPDGIPLLVAHNARCFDVPYLISEFGRCSMNIPHDWLFLDTRPLARELMKLIGSKVRAKVTLQALCEHYDVPLVGSAHRAMADVNRLCTVLEKMSYDMRLTTIDLIKRSFCASELTELKNKNSRN